MLAICWVILRCVNTCGARASVYPGVPTFTFVNTTMLKEVFASTNDSPSAVACVCASISHSGHESRICIACIGVFVFRAGSWIRGYGGLGSPFSGFWPGGRQRRLLGCTPDC
jgi:hypothetical protein